MHHYPRDEIARILAGLMEKLIQDMEDGDGRRLVGFTIIAASGDPPGGNRMTEEDHPISYEVIEGPERIYITAELPPTLTTAPYVDINPDRIILFIEGTETVVDLPVRIDVTRSSYQIRRRTLDIWCYKH